MLLALTGMLLGPSGASARLAVEKVDIGFGNSYASGAWTPIRLTLENLLPDGKKASSSDQDFSGYVQIRVSDYRGQSVQYHQEIELPLHSRKRVEFQIMLSTNSPLVVELVDRKGVTRVQKHIAPPQSANLFGSLRHNTYVVPTVLVLQSPAETFTLPFSLNSPAVSIKTVADDELPFDYKGYDGVRLLVVRSRLTERLKPQQLEALDRWIQFGGKLAVVTPRNPKEIREDPWLAARLPTLPGDVLELTLKDLNAESEALPVLVSRWETAPRKDQVLWGTAAGPAALVERRGAGAVYALGIDPSAFGPAELGSPIGREAQALLEAWVLGQGRDDLRARHLWSTADVDPDFKDVMLLPNLWIVTLLIVLFVVVVGPLNFFLLRRRRQLEWAWATIPGLSIFFFIAVYAYGAAAKGGDQHFASSDVLHLGPGSSEGLLLSSQIQFSPKKGVYRLAAPRGGIVVPLLQYYDDPTNPNAFNLANALGYGRMNASASDIGATPTVLRNEAGDSRLLSPVEQWTMQFYEAEVPMQIRGALDGSVKLLGEDRLELAFHNGSDLELLEATLYLGEEIYRVGPIAPGEKFERILSRSGVIPARSFNQPTSGPGDKSKFASSADYLIRQGAARVYPHFAMQNPQRGARLVARPAGWKNPIVVDPAPDLTKTHGLVEISLPVHWSGERALSTRSRLTRRVYSLDSLNTQVEDATQGVFCRLRDSSVEILLGQAWEGTRSTFKRGTLSLAFTSYTEDLTISAYNYQTGRWELFYESARDNGVLIDRAHAVERAIEPAWVNPIHPMVRLQFSSFPKSASGGSGGGGNVFSSNYGVSLNVVDATMTLVDTGADTPPQPEPESKSGDMTVAEDASLS